jgi:hypothetical protein
MWKWRKPNSKTSHVSPSPGGYAGRSPKGIAGRLGSGPALGPRSLDMTPPAPTAGGFSFALLQIRTILI